MALCLPAGPALADPPDAVAGTVVDRTAAHGPLAAVAVGLQVYRDQAFQRELPGTTDRDGHFRFAGLDPDAALQYVPVVQYQGVSYHGTPVRLADAGADPAHDDVAVYETTATDPGLRYQNATLVLGDVAQATQHLNFLLLFTLENPSDRTYVPATPGQGMATGLVRFGLPPGVDDIGVQSGLALDHLIEVDRGLASTAPVPPGATTISFSFAVPYQPPTFAFAWPLIYPTSAVHLLEPTSGPTLTAPGLTPEPDLELQGHTFHVLGRGPLPASGTVAVTVAGLHGRTWLQALAARLPRSRALPVAALAAAVLAAGLPLLYLRRRRTGGAPARDDAEALLDQLAALDDAHERGEVADGPYAERRAALKARLSRIMPAEAAEPT